MGQQQLILLVLATVIVGVAIVVGIRAFTENSAKSNADALVQDAVRIGNDIQAWAKKPVPFGGPAAGQDFADAQFKTIGYAETSGQYSNLNGVFTLAPVSGGVQVTGYGFDGATPDSTLSNSVNLIRVNICGMTDTDIKGAIETLGGKPTTQTVPAC